MGRLKTNLPKPIGTTASEGVSDLPARSDHVHAVDPSLLGQVSAATYSRAELDARFGAEAAARAAADEALRNSLVGGLKPGAGAEATRLAVFSSPTNLAGFPELTWTGGVLGVTGSVQVTATVLAGLVHGGTIQADDQAGTGERMVLAQAEGTQRAEDGVRYEASEPIVGVRLEKALLDAALAVVDNDPNPSASMARVVQISTGRLYGWDATARYVWWSDDDGATWTAHDYGSGWAVNAIPMVGFKDGVETMMLVSYGSTLTRWATCAAPPVVTSFTAPILLDNRPGVTDDGQFVLAGADAGGQADVARYVGGDTWGTADITVSGGFAGGNSAITVIKTATGRYIASLWSFFEKSTFIRYSDDFVTWSALTDYQSLGSNEPALRYLAVHPSGRIVAIVAAPNYTPTSRYSDDNGVTWSAGTITGVGANTYPAGLLLDWDAVLGQFVVPMTDGKVLVSTDGANWTVGASLGANYGTYVGRVQYDATRAKVRLLTNNDLQIDDHAGATSRLQTAETDGVLTPREKLVWDEILARLSIDGHLSLKSVRFNTAGPGITLTEGDVAWNDQDKTLDIQPDILNARLQVGQENWVRVVNKTGAPLLDGQVVYVNDAQGNRPTVALADASATSTVASKTIGVVTADIANDATGYVVTFGLLRGFNTSAFSDGDELWLNPAVPGGVTNVEPAAPAHRVRVGYALNSTNNGLLFVAPHYAGDLHRQNAATKDPTGWENNSTIAESYSAANRTITLTQTGLAYWWRGERKTLTSPWTSSAHTDADGTYFLYSTDGINFAWATSAWDFDHVMVAAVIRNAALGTFCLREVHGLMPWENHRADHYNRGTWRLSGGALTAGTYQVQPAVPANADNTPGVDAVTIVDEDNPDTLAALLDGATYKQVRFVGSTATSSDGTYPFRVTGTYPNINAGGAEVETSTGKFFNVWVIGVPVTDDAASQAFRFLWIQPQVEHGSLASAQAEAFGSLNYGNLLNLVIEFAPLTKITFRTNAAYGTVGKCRIEAVEYLTVSRAGSAASSVLSAHEATHEAGGSDALPWTTINGRGLLSARPAASALNAGYRYETTDTGVRAIYRSDGTNWNLEPGIRSDFWPLNIKDYGAVGDNLTHPLSGYYASDAAAQAAFPRTHAAYGVTLADQIDWAATQEALLDAVNLTIKRSVFAPAGRYRTHRRITVPDGVLFAGEGGTHEQTAYPRTVFRAIADDFCMLYANNFSIVRDITIDCFDRALWGIHLGPGNRPQLQQVLVNRAKEYGIVLDRTQNGIYYSCTAYYCWRGVVLLNGARNNCFFGLNASTDSRFFTPSGDRTYVTSCILLYLIDLTNPRGFGTTTDFATENGNDRNQFYGGIWERTSLVVKTENPYAHTPGGMGEHADSVFNGIEMTFYGAGTGRACAFHSTFPGRFTFHDCYFRGPDADTVVMEGSPKIYAYFEGSCFFYNAGDNLPFRGVNVANNLVSSINARSADEYAPDPSAAQEWYYAGGTTNNTITWDATLKQFTVTAVAPADRGLGVFPRGIIGRGNGNALRKTFYATKLTVRVKFTIDYINDGAGQYVSVAASFAASPWRRKLGNYGLGPHEVVFTTTPGSTVEQGAVEFLSSGCYVFKISGISVEVV